jgi:hypothetical protein
MPHVLLSLMLVGVLVVFLDDGQGMDIECGSFFQSNLANAVADGAVTQDMMDTALTHLYSVQVLA